MFRRLAVPILGAAVFCSPLAADPDTGNDDRLRAMVSILPQAYFVERVGGERVKVEVLVGPGQSPATFEPTPKQMVALGRSAVLFCVGVLYEERLLERIQAALPDLPVVRTQTGIPRRGGGCAHAPAGGDPHIWLDPQLVGTMSDTICHHLCLLDSLHAETYRRNLMRFKAELDSVHAVIQEILAPVSGRRMYVFHPAFAYFAAAYGLEQVAIEVEGKEPTARQLADLLDRAESDSVRAVFVQPQFSSKSAEALAQSLGALVIAIDPLSRDYLNNLQTIARKVKYGLTGSE